MRRTGSKTFCLASWHGDEVSGGQEPAAAAGFSMLGWLKLEKRGGTRSTPPRLSAVAIAAPKRRKRRNSVIRLVSIRGFRLTHIRYSSLRLRAASNQCARLPSTGAYSPAFASLLTIPHIFRRDELMAILVRDRMVPIWVCCRPRAQGSVARPSFIYSAVLGHGCEL